MDEDTLIRERLERLARVLRKFGIVDRFELSSLLTGDDLPSVPEIEALLRRHREDLPTTIEASYLADVVHRALVSEGDARHTRLRAGIKRLNAIPTGNAAADDYHNNAMQLLNDIFSGVLSFSGKEVNEFGGRKRIDILYKNLHSGFMRLLPDEGRACRFVPAECKNYSCDPENPEFDQLSGRLKPDVGNFGILVCRHIADPKAALDRCRTYKDKKELIITLTDDDLSTWVDEILAGAKLRLVEKKLRNLLLA